MLTQDYLAKGLAELIAGHLDGGTVHLFTNDVDPGEGAVEGDFTEATFDGSADKPIGTFGDAFVDPDGNVKAVAPTLQWNWADGADETVYGVYFMDGDSVPGCAGYDRFETPIQMANALDAIVLQPALILGHEKCDIGVSVDN